MNYVSLYEIPFQLIICLSQVSDINICYKTWCKKYLILGFWTSFSKLHSSYFGSGLPAPGDFGFHIEFQCTILWSFTEQHNKMYPRAVVWFYICMKSLTSGFVFLCFVKCIKHILTVYFLFLFLNEQIIWYWIFYLLCLQAFRRIIMIPAHGILALCLVFQVFTISLWSSLMVFFLFMNWGISLVCVVADVDFWAS